MGKKILIVDDEKLIRDFIKSFIESSKEFSKYSVDLACNGEEAIAKIKQNSYEVIFTDLKMPNKSGLDVIKTASEISPETDCVLITAFGGGESAQKAMAYGAYEYITKPVSIDEIELILRHITERRELIEENQKLQKALTDKTVFPKIIGKSPKIKDIMDIVKMVAPTNATVLITGESGTGKELVAEAIHTLSPRSDNNFVKINCAALPESLIESELFGFEKGSFTGAIKRTRGKFEMADGGSILLDEISEMNLDLQAKLLRVIQEKEINRIGSEQPIKINTRIIATSNRDLAEEVKNGRFREDLFFRLNIVPINLPPLRIRKDDIPSLVDSFLKKLSFDLGVRKKNISSDVMELLLNYDWPGNIRELQNAIERAIITTPSEMISTDAFTFISQKIHSDSGEKKAIPSITQQVEFDDMTLAEVEKILIYRALDKTDNNKNEAARILGVTSRTLRNKLHLYENDIGEVNN
ncbi:MAG: sigma-54 dependent transcriptional regulator [Candidatus Cloacimonetes bacterium]|nr:sigma-54 dependent transcriptional regulator [Candidatus Cloacimonadota bacterium]